MSNICWQDEAKQLALAAHIMVEEPAWPSLLADQQPQDWPGSSAPANHHQDLMYLSSEKAMSNVGAQAIHSLYLFMLVAMVDPVIAGDGHTYERTAIQHWLQGSSLSPVTGDKLPHTRLVPNVLVKSALAQHTQVS
ncbi:hypothetical protein ABBQ38_011912 [Trebouxia sp. C0009 RCD-2024]